MSEKPPLSDDARELFEAERELEPLPLAMRERLATRLSPLLLPIPLLTGGGGGSGGSGPGDPGVGASSAGASSVGAGTATAAGLSGKVIVAAISLAVGGLGGAGAHAWLSTSAPAPAAVVSTPPITAITSPSTSEPSLPAPSAAIEPATTAAPAVSATRPRMDDRGPGNLTAERLLLQTATAALARGDRASAIAALQKHARRFPNGELAQEREVLLKRALK